MQVEYFTNFIKITPEENFYILSTPDNYVTNTSMYLSTIDDLDNYTEITREQAQEILIQQCDNCVIIPEVCPFDHCENLFGYEQH